MIPMSLEGIAAATGGKLVGRSTGTVTCISQNSKELPPGCAFIAIHGETHDGHKFLPDVAGKAVAAIVHREAGDLAIPQVVVADTRKTLGQLAHHVRKSEPLAKTKFIAIGGSNGKTTTKHLVGSVLSSAFKGTQSPKSFNNDIGVPLTILGVSPGDDYVVLELGTNHPGELAPLSQMAEPDLVAITSIGPEHLEGFGDIDGVRREEASIIDGLHPGGLCIANGDDVELARIAKKAASRVVTFGFSAGNDLRISSVDCSLEGIRFEVDGIPDAFYLPLPGRHNASNALVAIAIGREFGMRNAHIRDALANCSRPEMRMQVQRLATMTILNDAYNANPASMVAGIETLLSAKVPGRRVAVLGEMRELGHATAAMHRDIGHLAAKLDLLVCVGEAARLLADSARESGLKSIHWVADADAAASLVRTLVRDHDTILLKASRSIKLEKVAQRLQTS